MHLARSVGEESPDLSKEEDSHANEDDETDSHNHDDSAWIRYTYNVRLCSNQDGLFYRMKWLHHVTQIHL